MESVSEIRVGGGKRTEAAVTIVDDDVAGQVDEISLLNEPALPEDWNGPEEDVA